MDNNSNTSRFILATLLSAGILLGFQYFYAPKQPAQPPAQPAGQLAQHPGAPAPALTNVAASTPALVRPAADVVKATLAQRLPFEGPDVKGTFNLVGARLDDLTLTHYRQTTSPQSPLVRLLRPAGTPHPNYVVLGWDGMPGHSHELPGPESRWQVEGAPGQVLTPEHPVTLSWDNGRGATFHIHLALDKQYMFSVRQSVDNATTSAPLYVRPFQRVERDYLPADTGSMTAYEGPIGVMNGHLEDAGYKKLRKNSDNPAHIAWEATGHGGWVGITDKYWLTAVAAPAQSLVTASYGYVMPPGAYLATMAGHDIMEIAPGATLGADSHVFAGAKVASILNGYSKQLQVPGFEKAIDFGWFSYLTKPIFWLLHWLYSVIGNFGLALMAMTLVVKLILFPLAYKAAVSAGRMRLLAPRIKAIKERNKDDPAAAQMQMMALYREEKVNPAGGCLPVLIQAPIFFCLYKVLNISIDARQAPFFGWIHDLSEPDPTNALNLFGLLPFNPAHYATFLHVSLWGAALGLTFWLLQRQTQMVMDPSQQKVMRFMPLVYVFIMTSFPASLLVYYTWNNILTFMQQYVIERHAKLPKALPPEPEKG
ncbi:membrane protein insertase YidC [Formicincola oecophyllae]|uniref:Membrane protein insertase YidC n=1 Tax=Formicincola oecophyllae TaxID=2558361 RepID=A0A4Y6U8V0_9PROT|nr:membrane protein insertase YidC [Formicincola oecophyllae]QDH13893.1 membrane protein insertase YidC [Formicincola oecophyllae]